MILATTALATLGLSFAAGVLSTLSPCVLPLLPVVLGTAAAEHRMGPAALAAGLATSFVAIGLFVATIGFSIGLDGGVFRLAAACLMIAIGAVLLLPALQAQVALAAGPASTWASQKLGGVTGEGLGGQFAIGAILGAVWSPCVGPTLGAASVLAAQGQDLPQVAATMAMFGLGAAAPLLVLGMLSREMMLNLRGRLMSAGGNLKAILGFTLVAVGLAVATGLDKRIEATLVDISPAWLTNLTTML